MNALFTNLQNYVQNTGLPNFLSEKDFYSKLYVLGNDTGSIISGFNYTLIFQSVHVKKFSSFELLFRNRTDPNFQRYHKLKPMQIED